MLGELRQRWAPEAFVASFKLETDEQLLVKKVGCQDLHGLAATLHLQQLQKRWQASLHVYQLTSPCAESLA